MKQVTLKRISPYRPDQMFDLIGDVARYHEFLPHCVGSRVRRREQKGADEVMLADLMIRYKLIHETYSSEVLLQADAGKITVRQSRGPFRSLSNEWQFIATETGCQVLFNLSFEFKISLLGRVLAPMMDHAVERMVSAFEARAHALYGPQAGQEA